MRSVLNRFALHISSFFYNIEKTRRESMAGFKRLKASLQEKKDTNLLFALVQRYLNNNISTKSAAMAYYLVFTLFPLMIVLGNVLALFHINVDTLTSFLKPLMPMDTIQLLASYISYVNESFSPVFLSFAIIFSIYFPYRAIKDLMEDVRAAYGLGKRASFLSSLWRELVCTFLIPLSLLLSFLLVVLGENVIRFFLGFFPADFFHISDLILHLWQYLRFVVAALLMGASLGVLYQLSLDQWVRFKKVVPGIAFAILVWIVMCIGFSFYVENFAHYSVIYGALGGFIVLLLWLYWTSLIFIMGGEFNAAIEKKRQIEMDVQKA